MWGAAQELAGKGVPGWRWDVTVPELWGRYGSFFVHSLVLKMLTEPGVGGQKRIDAFKFGDLALWTKSLHW